MEESATQWERKALGETFDLQDVVDANSFDNEETVVFDYDARTGELDKIWAEPPAAPKADIVKCKFEMVSEESFRVIAVHEMDFSDPHFSSEWKYFDNEYDPAM